MAKAPHQLGDIVHSVRDQHGLIQVVDTDTTRSLYFDSPVEQSRYFFNAPLTLAFEYQSHLFEFIVEHAEQHPLKSVLFLGLGGGTLPTQLNALYPNCQQTIIELRQAVIDLAYDYFFLPDVPEITCLQQDAAEFMQSHQQQYDLVIVDLFDAQSMPDEFLQKPFLNALKQAKKSPGLVLFNLWSSLPADALKVIDYWETQTDIHVRLKESLSTGNILLCAN